MKNKMKNLPSFEEFINEQTLQDRTKNDFLESDWGWNLAHDKIEAHLGADASDIEELDLDKLSDFNEGEITTFSTKEKGNFVLNCGTSNGKPACRLEDELNNITKYYIKK